MTDTLYFFITLFIGLKYRKIIKNKNIKLTELQNKRLDQKINDIKSQILSYSKNLKNPLYTKEIDKNQIGYGKSYISKHGTWDKNFS